MYGGASTNVMNLYGENEDIKVEVHQVSILSSSFFSLDDIMKKFYGEIVWRWYSKSWRYSGGVGKYAKRIEEKTRNQKVRDLWK